MCAVLCLEYPNGRTHRVEVPEAIQDGQEINLYGHRWKVVGPVPRTPGTRLLSLSVELAAGPYLCRQTTG